jgi:hypothetical protein
MIKSIKARWQAWLDGTTVSMFDGMGEPDPAPVPHGVSGAPDPYKQLAALARPQTTTVRVYELTDANRALPAPTLATPAQREYEAGLPDWAREALAEMDRVVGAVLREETDEVRTPQYVRRHRRSLMETIGDRYAMTEDTDPNELVERMMARARRASDPDVTGVIPVIEGEIMAEEAWA